jgi:homotetrameric cytidine deaminase/rRNA maturation RNase YbeY
VKSLQSVARTDPRRLFTLLDPDTGCRHLGDVVISVERARAQAAQYGHGLRRELGYLLVHGICHLLGYDHVREEDRVCMRAAEEAALERAGLTREEISEGECLVDGQNDENDKKLLELARRAMDGAYVPYSNYPVGACLLTEDGRVFTGCNVENASYGATICAERTAVVKAVSEGALRFIAIAVAARGSAPYPCGICRQVLNEFGPRMRVLVTWDSQDGQSVEKTTLDALLPNSFGPESLGEKA